ncbi:AbiH family protein [Leeuwenhoekiella sp. ZYFB001]|uniref:AbiH family protein n=1 Tax=Leeuwenhoekiella sp. ZYFB001 TaxID=2719912 RepID=UPI0014305B66|nr:AbiH family protein [Leeuwenhoekiella sp. ZYFB001]
MNRIILVGNGFDLAHKLKTSYNDFINHYWQNIFDNLRNSLGGYIDLDGLTVEAFWDNGLPEESSYINFFKYCENYKVEYTFTNELIEVICKNQSIQNWVDLEDEYYRLVIKSINDQEINITKLNDDFANLKGLFIKYLLQCSPDFSNENLNEVFEKYYIDDIARHIYSDINIQDFTEEAVNEIAKKESEKLFDFIMNDDPKKDFSKYDQFVETLSYYLRNNAKIQKGTIEDYYDEIFQILISKDAHNLFDLSPESIFVLNFNYTNVSLLYSNHFTESHLDNDCKFQWPEINHIHGALNDNKNPIIFGFGDELDDNYSKIEKLNDNKYLENIKSIRYSDTDNYKKLLQYINSDQYQICIFGHSCGISDRTMLNTLFEHENCVSIKPYYHLREDGTDNYSDIVRNISRNFNNKASMRDKVVNKTYCEPLVRPEKNG